MKFWELKPKRSWRKKLCNEMSYHASLASKSARFSISDDRRKFVCLILISKGLIDGIIPFSLARIITPIVPVKEIPSLWAIFLAL